MASPLVFFQVATSAPARTWAFLSEIFDWAASEADESGAFAIGLAGPADFDVQGQLMPAGDGAQQTTLYFRVDDLEATVALAGERGVSIVMPATLLPIGVHVAMIRTPDDALTVGIVQA